MPKRTISFKPTPECETQLAELMDRWDCDRTAALVKAVQVAYLKRVPPELDPAISAAIREPSLSDSRPIARPSPTGGIDRDKIAAFQNMTGMDKAVKRK